MKPPTVQAIHGLTAPVAAALAPAAGANMRHAWAAPSAAGTLPLMAAILVPLMLPRVGESIKRMFLRADQTEAASAPQSDTDLCRSFSDDSYAELRHRYADTCRELNTLQSAYTTLANDAAERAVAADRLDHIAHHDPLTNLPNRLLLMDRLTQALTFAKRAGTGVLVIYLDLDHFKSINDTIGHAAGDRVLVEVGSRIAGCMRGADTASRLGGDEFVLIFATADGVTDAPQVAARILAAISAPIDVFGTLVTLGASLGISLSTVDGYNAGELIEKADAAMYCAKQRGRNCFNLYTAEIQAGIERKLQLETELRAALARNEFEVHYQPIVDVQSGTVGGAEALVRWKHPTRGLIGPHEFIAFAEEHGFAADIGTRVLSAVCRQLARFTFADGDDFSISINVSPQQFRQTGFAASMAAALAATGTDPCRLSIDVTEELLAAEPRAFATLLDLHRLGVGLTLDGFGKGTSSLANIKNLPVDKIKIDRSFVRDIAENATDEAIAKTIVTLAHSLELRVVAEGVETREQMQKLHALGSDGLQGFHVSYPLCGLDFERFACTYGALKLAA